VAQETAEKAVSPQRDVSLRELFLGFMEIGLSGFGGVLPWARRIIVERRGWIDSEEFTAMLGLCQFLPGPNVVNLSVVIGARFRGPAGALTAVLGMLAAPFVIVVGLGALYTRFGDLPGVQAVLRGMSAVAAGLIIAMGLRMAADLRRRPLAILLAVATFVAVALVRLPLPLVMLVLAPLGVAIAARDTRR
jgi:chromate transporter